MMGNGEWMKGWYFGDNCVRVPTIFFRGLYCDTYHTWFIAENGNVLVMSAIGVAKPSVQTFQQSRLVPGTEQIVEPNRLDVLAGLRIGDIDGRAGAEHMTHHVGVRHVEFIVTHRSPFAIVVDLDLPVEWRLAARQSDFEVVNWVLVIK